LKTVFLGLGSNIGNRGEYIKRAITLLSEKIKNIQVAKMYRSKPYGYENQNYFLNTALKGQTTLHPQQLLDFVKDVEKKVGRVKRFHWGPREIDIDILFYEDLILETENLKIPHPLLHERDFVLKPLSDLQPDFIHPVLKKSVKEILKNLKEHYVEEV
jgi:2-amino-4-hydroxy-6-hydroxymethyldihydropteridine diphosphokinase